MNGGKITVMCYKQLGEERQRYAANRLQVLPKQYFYEKDWLIAMIVLFLVPEQAKIQLGTLGKCPKHVMKSVSQGEGWSVQNRLNKMCKGIAKSEVLSDFK